jgi:hypothetical protein
MPKGLDMIARTVPDNVDWEDTKHKSVLFDPFDEKRRTIAGGENWYQGYVRVCCGRFKADVFATQACHFADVLLVWWCDRKNRTHETS